MLPKMVNLNGNIYNTVGMVKLNNSAFLFAVNANELVSVDFTQIPSLSSLIQFQVKEPTSVELVFINYIQNVLQDKLNNGQMVNVADLTQAISSVNRFVNTHQELLTNMAELDGKDQMVESLKDNLLSYFEDEMSQNEYFQKPVINEPVVEEIVMQQDLPNNDIITDPIVFSEPTFTMDEPLTNIDYNYVEPTVEAAPAMPEVNFGMPMVPEQPMMTNVDYNYVEPMVEAAPAMPEVNFGIPMVPEQPMMTNVDYNYVEPMVEAAPAMPEVNFGIPMAPEQPMTNVDYNYVEPMVEAAPAMPEYDKDTVDLVLQSPVDPNFDVTSFINTYYDHFTMEQINMLLSGKYQLNEQQETILKQRKGTIQIYNSLEAAEAKKEEPSVELQQEKRKKLVRKEKPNQAAFVDTLLLSFTVGTICGVYLMYFVLTIMS